MFEATATEQIRLSIAEAHTERARAFAAAIRWIVSPVRALRWPQVNSRRWQAPPQVCPAGQ